jgi:hypothetical protein
MRSSELDKNREGYDQEYYEEMAEVNDDSVADDIDRAADKTKETLRNAADKTKDATERAWDTMKEKGQEIKDEFDDS